MQDFFLCVVLIISSLTSCLAQTYIRISDPGDIGNTFLIDCDNASSPFSTNVFLFDSGLTENYSENESYIREISSSNGGEINLKFTQFSLAGGTVLTIRDAITHEIFTSNATGTQLVGQTFTSHRGSLQIIWSSGANVSYGFRAAVWCGSMCQQFQTTITPSINPTVEGTNTYYDICNGTEINFSATSEFYQNNVQYAQYEDSLTYDWGVIETNNDTLLFYNAGRNFSFTFTENGAFSVFCNASDTHGCLNNNFNLLRVRVSIPPTWEDVSFYPDSVCSGSQITLIGELHPETWYEPINHNLNTDTLFLPDGDDICYSTSLYLDISEEGAIVTSINDIEKIYLNMEYSFLGDLSIMIECPNGQNCLLHAYSSQDPTIAPGWTLSEINNLSSSGGHTVHLGLSPDPNTFPSYNACDDIPGVGYSYNFTPDATINFGTNNNTLTTTIYEDPCGEIDTIKVLNEGDYASYESMASLVGCPINGLWTLYVCDHLIYDNGYIFEWGIYFSEDVYHNNMWSYSTSYPESSFSWTGEGLQTGMNGDSYATVIVYNSDTTNWREVPYTFTATDNFGCTYDTTIIVHVKPAMHEDCDSTTSMDNGILTEEISILPNPAYDILNISSSSLISSIEIVNTLGQVVYRTEVNADNAVCDVNGLANGVYVVRIHGTDMASVIQKKFIKE